MKKRYGNVQSTLSSVAEPVSATCASANASPLSALTALTRDPCACYATAAFSSSGSSSLSSSSHRLSSAAGVGSVGRVSNLIDREPAFRRSRSLAVPFLRSKPSADQNYNSHKTLSSFWSLFKGGHGNRSTAEGD
ncbi:hypothetical protein OIU74_014861 [Salix koriyanagi]|uniref:Uncharacterized protein n=1 Tax=Salix koriyanagi TaxID=2511006 RepID=A0A9Q0PWU9_9ROSI|nr:hypothetical protein OIU74_014861 [Salix koriyanagi]